MACNLTQDRSCPLLFLFVQAAPDTYIVCVSYVLKHAAQHTDTDFHSVLKLPLYEALEPQMLVIPASLTQISREQFVKSVDIDDIDKINAVDHPKLQAHGSNQNLVDS
jgi:hypothetical protein